MRRRQGVAGRCRRSEDDASDPGLPALRSRGRQTRAGPVRPLPLGGLARSAQAAVPGLWPRPGPAAGHRSVRAMLTHLPSVPGTGAVCRARSVQGMRATTTVGRRASRMPTLRQASDSADRHWVVRAVLAPRPTTEPGRGLRRLRAGHPTGGRGSVPNLLGPLTAPDPGSGRQHRCDTARATRLVRRLRRLPGGAPPSQPGLHDAHRTRPPPG